METEVVVVVGASRGLGRALALCVTSRLLAGEVPSFVHVVLAARDTASLDSTAAAIRALWPMQPRPGTRQTTRSDEVPLALHTVQVDLTSADASGGVDAIVSAVRHAVEAAQEHKRPTWRVTLIYAASVHEPAAVQDGQGAWRYSNAADWPTDQVTSWRRVNVGGAVALLACLRSDLRLDSPDAQRGPKLVFVFLSSQAAEPRWWPLGNDVYGRHKHEAEAALARLVSMEEQGGEEGSEPPSKNIRLLCLRYPFVATDMAEQLFAELLLVDAGLHVDPTDLASAPLARDKVFLPLDATTADTAALLMDEGDPGTASPFRCVDPPHVFSYEPPHRP